MGKFARSPLVRESLIVCAISVIRRWHLARSVDSRAEAAEGVTIGVRRALQSFLADCRRIIAASDVCAEYWLSTVVDAGGMRMLVWRAIGRAHMYLIIGNIPYSNGMWRIIRGVGEPEQARNSDGARRRFRDGGLECVVEGRMGKLGSRRDVDE